MTQLSTAAMKVMTQALGVLTTTLSLVCRAFFFMVKHFSLGCLKLKLKALRSFEM